MSLIRIGYKWTDTEDKHLFNEYEESKMNVLEISKRHGRTPGAILYRLQTLNLIDKKVCEKEYEEYRQSEKKKFDIEQLKIDVKEIKENVSKILELMNALYEFENK